MLTYYYVCCKCSSFIKNKSTNQLEGLWPHAFPTIIIVAYIASVHFSTLIYINIKLYFPHECKCNYTFT